MKLEQAEKKNSDLQSELLDLQARHKRAAEQLRHLEECNKNAEQRIVDLECQTSTVSEQARQQQIELDKLK